MSAALAQAVLSKLDPQRLAHHAPNQDHMEFWD